MDKKNLSSTNRKSSAVHHSERHHGKETIVGVSGSQNDHPTKTNADKSSGEDDKLSLETFVSDHGDRIRPRPSPKRIVQNFRLIWLDQNIDETKEYFKNSLTDFQNIIPTLRYFTNSEKCIECVKTFIEDKVFLIVSGTLGQKVVPIIHDMAQINTIIVFCVNKERHKPWAKEWSKIEGVHCTSKSIYKILANATNKFHYNNMPMCFIPQRAIIETDGSNKQNLDELPATFMYSTIFKEIILEIADEPEKDMHALVDYCNKEKVSATQVTKFQQQYHEKSPVWWYTCEMFLYRMLNQALRTLDTKGMAKMGFFIRRLHCRLLQLYQEQSSNFQEKFFVFRGQGLSQEDFRGLCESKGGLLSFNNFLSTSRKKEISKGFVLRTINEHKDLIGVLFIMNVDPKNISATETPFALVDDESAMNSKEDEILFTMHTVFRVMNINESSENPGLHEVELAMTGDNDPQLNALTKQLKKEVNGRGWYRMGKLMLRVGHFSQAEELYYELLKDITSDGEKPHIYHMLGMVKNYQGKYRQAVMLYEESLKIKLKTVPDDDISLAPTYSNVGLVYKNMGDYSKALEFHEKALKVKEKALSPNHSDFATSYISIASVYEDMGNYSKALEFHEKSLKIIEKALPPNHPDLAIYFNNIGSVYNKIGDYSKAREFYEKSLKILERALPLDHPDLATTYNNIGGVYMNMGDYSKAVEFIVKATQIFQKILLPNHPDLAISYNNIGLMYNNIGDYSKALAFYEKSHQILEKVLPPNHPSLATSYNNIASVYADMDDYSKALEFYEKSVKIFEIILPPNHPNLACLYNNMGMTYFRICDYPKALEQLEKALSILQSSLPAGHPDIKATMNSIAVVRKKM